MMIFLRRLLSFMFVISVSFVVVELFFRIQVRLGLGNQELPYMRIITDRLDGVWLASFQNTTTIAWPHWFPEGVRKKAFLLPPMTTFANVGFEREDRLQMIYQFAKLPISQTWQGIDYLLSPDQRAASHYQASSDEFGFRMAHHQLQKTRKTFRILCLGAYTSFGYAVNDEQTFPFQLEQALNRKKSQARHYEVWNGGISAATAIMGLSRISKDIEQIHPDLILLDYGIVDLTLEDHDLVAPGEAEIRGVKPQFESGLVRNSHGWLRQTFELLFLKSPFTKTDIGEKINEKIFDAEDFRQGKIQFFLVMKKMLQIADESKIPVAFMNQAGFSGNGIFEELAKDTGKPFIDIFQILPKQSEQVLKEFDAHPSWTDEFKDNYEGLAEESSFQIRNLMNDIFQLNPEGHRLLGEGMARVLLQDKLIH